MTPAGGVIFFFENSNITPHLNVRPTNRNQFALPVLREAEECKGDTPLLHHNLCDIVQGQQASAAFSPHFHSHWTCHTDGSGNIRVCALHQRAFTASSHMATGGLCNGRLYKNLGSFPVRAVRFINSIAEVQTGLPPNPGAVNCEPVTSELPL